MLLKNGASRDHTFYICFKSVLLERDVLFTKRTFVIFIIITIVKILALPPWKSEGHPIAGRRGKYFLAHGQELGLESCPARVVRSAATPPLKG